MELERSIDKIHWYRDRMILHRRFFVPAAIALFLAFPGSLAFLHLPGFFTGLALERLEWGMFTVLFFIPYFWFVVTQRRLAFKLGLGSLFHPLYIILCHYRVRGEFFDVDQMENFFQITLFTNYFPMIGLFTFLCMADEVKRSRVTCSVLVASCVALFSWNYRSLDRTGSLDAILTQDISERIRLRDFSASNQLSVECGKLSSEKARTDCVLSIRTVTHSQVCAFEKEADVDECVEAQLKWSKRIQMQKQAREAVQEPESEFDPEAYAPVEAGIR